MFACFLLVCLDNDVITTTNEIDHELRIRSVIEAVIAKLELEGVLHDARGREVKNDVNGRTYPCMLVLSPKII